MLNILMLILLCTEGNKVYLGHLVNPIEKDGYREHVFL